MKRSFKLWKYAVTITKEKKIEEEIIEEEIEIIGKEEFEAIYEDEEREFNISILKEGIRQAELKLKDTNAIRNTLEKRAYNLFFFFVSFITVLVYSINASIYIITVTNNIKRVDAIEVGNSLYSFSGISLIVIIVIAFFFMAKLWKALALSDRGVQGWPPEFWLDKKENRKNAITGDENTEGYLLATILSEYQESIEKGESSNKKKTYLIDCARKTLTMMLLIFLIRGVVTYFI